MFIDAGVLSGMLSMPVSLRDVQKWFPRLKYKRVVVHQDLSTMLSSKGLTWPPHAELLQLCSSYSEIGERRALTLDCLLSADCMHQVLQNHAILMYICCSSPFYVLICQVCVQANLLWAAAQIVCRQRPLCRPQPPVNMGQRVMRSSCCFIQRLLLLVWETCTVLILMNILVLTQTVFWTYCITSMV